MIKFGVSKTVLGVHAQNLAFFAKVSTWPSLCKPTYAFTQNKEIRTFKHRMSDLT